jgi:hypothetical protein
MTTQTFDLDALEIIGYSSKLETPTLPRVLAPVFRVRGEPDLILFPPFTILAAEVLKAHQGNRAEFEEFIAKGKLTQLPTTYQAKVQHDLWVSPEGVVAYEPKAEVKKAFEELYAKHLNLAEAKLAEKDYEAAARHAAVARSVDPGKLDPLIIRGVTEFALEDQSYYEFTRELAEKIVKPEEFDQRVRERMEAIDRDAEALARRAAPSAANRLIQDQDRTEGSVVVAVCTRGAQVMDGMIHRRTRFATVTTVTLAA